MAVEVATQPEVQPTRSRFQVVPVPGEFTRGRWKCWDYKSLSKLVAMRDKTKDEQALERELKRRMELEKKKAEELEKKRKEESKKRKEEGRKRREKKGDEPERPTVISKFRVEPVSLPPCTTTPVQVQPVATVQPVQVVAPTPIDKPWQEYETPMKLTSTCTVISVGPAPSPLQVTPGRDERHHEEYKTVITRRNGQISAKRSLVKEPPEEPQQPATTSRPAQIVVKPAVVASEVVVHPPQVLTGQPVQAAPTASVHVTTPVAAGVTRVRAAVCSKNQVQASENGHSVVMQNVVQEEEPKTTTAAAITGAIDNKIEQAMDLVKTHLTFAVREEVENLRQTIADLEMKVNSLQAENSILRKYAPVEITSQLIGSQSAPSVPAIQTVVVDASTDANRPR